MSGCGVLNTDIGTCYETHTIIAGRGVKNDNVGYGIPLVDDVTKGGGDVGEESTITDKVCGPHITCNV